MYRITTPARVLDRCRRSVADRRRVADEKDLGGGFSREADDRRVRTPPPLLRGRHLSKQFNTAAVVHAMNYDNKTLPRSSTRDEQLDHSSVVNTDFCPSRGVPNARHELGQS